VLNAPCGELLLVPSVVEDRVQPSSKPQPIRVNICNVNVFSKTTMGKRPV